MKEVPTRKVPPKIGVVTPMANEEQTVDRFLERVLLQLGDTDKVVCILDHASKDRTRQLVELFSRRDSRVVCVWSPANECFVDAYFCGYKHALASGCDWILEMDAGLSHLPEEIPRFLEQMRAGADFVAGSRFLPGGRYESRWSRFLVSRLGSIVTNLVLGTRMWDMTSGFQCFTAKALREVVVQGVRSRAHFFQTEIRFMMHSWKWVEVPITYSNASNGVGVLSLLDALRVLVDVRRHKGSRASMKSRNCPVVRRACCGKYETGQKAGAEQ